MIDFSLLVFPREKFQRLFTQVQKPCQSMRINENNELSTSIIRRNL